MLKIDIFNHVLPKKFFDRLHEINPNMTDIVKRMRNIPSLSDIDLRLRQLEEFGDEYRQIISNAMPPPEMVGTPEHSAELCRIANDEMAKIVESDDRFMGFIASVPMDNEEGIALEIDHAIHGLGAVGVQVFTNVKGAALDQPQFLPLFEKMAEYDLPIWVHPTRGAAHPDYIGEERSWYEIWWTFGWPYETSAMMARLVYSGYFDKYPNLKVITHHMGGNTPFHGGRVGPGNDQLGARTSDYDLKGIKDKLQKRPLDYFKMFYGDTCSFGSLGALICGMEFFGPDHIVFASDSPFDPEKGPGYIRETMRLIDAWDISAADRQKIYQDNAVRLLKLNI